MMCMKRLTWLCAIGCAALSLGAVRVNATWLDVEPDPTNDGSASASKNPSTSTYISAYATALSAYNHAYAKTRSYYDSENSDLTGSASTNSSWWKKAKFEVCPTYAEFDYNIKVTNCGYVAIPSDRVSLSDHNG